MIYPQKVFMWEDLCNKSIKKGQNKMGAQHAEMPQMTLLLNINITNGQLNGYNV